MDFGKLNSWLQVSANIGIVLGLVLVSVQLKQNSDLARIQMLNEQSQRIVDYELEVIANDDRSVTDYILTPQRNMEPPDAVEW